VNDLRTSDRDVDRVIRSWLQEDRHEDASRIASAVLDLVEATPRRRARWWSARRTPLMNKIVTIGLAAAAILVVIVVGTQVLATPQPGSVGDAPSAAPSARATQTPVASTAASEATPTDRPQTGLPEGPFLLLDPLTDLSTTVEIPAPGWTHDEVGLFKGEDVDNVPEAAVLVWPYAAGTQFYVPGDPCRAESTRPADPMTTVDEIVSALAAQASRDATDPADVTIGGYPGKSITLHTPDDLESGACELDAFVTLSTATDALSRYQQGPGQVDELWFVDVDGIIVMIDATRASSTSQQLIDEMRAIAESATFELP
jgi:hypothetical protein